MANRHLDRVLQNDYLVGLDDWPLEEIRARRSECQRLEDAASYLRRLIQTRLDIIGTQLSVRSSGASNELADLLETLPSILSEGQMSRTTGGRLLADELGEDQEAWAQRVVTGCCGTHDVESVSEISDSELKSLTDCLTDLEKQVSHERRTLHDVLDRLQAEIVSRYKSGRATVDGLLR
jgi:hypothetical protein